MFGILSSVAAAILARDNYLVARNSAALEAQWKAAQREPVQIVCIPPPRIEYTLTPPKPVSHMDGFKPLVVPLLCASAIVGACAGVAFIAFKAPLLLAALT